MVIMNLEGRSWIDISPQLSQRTAVFPGDTAFSREVLLDFKSGAHLELSTMRTTLHLGAHADAPSHYRRDAAAIHKVDLGDYFGLAQVVRIPKKFPRLEIGLDDWASREVKAKRILFATGSFPDPNSWTPDFAYFSPELIRYLASKQVRLIGIDTPSVDSVNSKDLLSHNAVADADLRILEGLELSSVAEGLYDLIALPLRLELCEASPVRAILLPRESELEKERR